MSMEKEQRNWVFTFQMIANDSITLNILKLKHGTEYV